jgi:hypothetical protein
MSNLKKLAILANKVRELINKLEKRRKSGVTSENESLFLESASELHSKLTEIHECGLPGHEACFNELLKKVSKEVRDACNELLSTLTPPIQFSFELFPGPEDEAIAKVNEAHRAHEEKKRLLEESIDASRRREELGFTSDSFCDLLPPLFARLIRDFITTPCPDAEEAVQYPKHRKMTDCERICVVLYDKSKFSEFVVGLHGSWDQGLQSRRMCSFMMNARICMQSNPNCPTCTIFSIVCQMAHGLSRDDETKVCRSPSINLTRALLVAGMSRFDKYKSLFLDTYLFVIGSDFWQKTVRTTTIPNIRDAITNPKCAFKGELISSLTDHLGFCLECKMNDVSDSIFENWMYWYKSKESDSSFHPYSFLPKFR